MIVGILAACFIAMYLYVVKRERDIRKEQKLEQKLEDNQNANDILTKSITRKPERVHKLDNAGYRD